MAASVLEAIGFGAFYKFVGMNGQDDTVTVNIHPDFSGTITVDSLPSDGEIDNTVINLPPGWALVVVKLEEDATGEDPSFKDYSYEVLNADGLSVGTLSIRSNNIQGAPCFVQGTKIQTAQGEVRIEDLRPGMQVLTRDHGLQPVRWIGMRGIDLAQDGAQSLCPVRIRAGALGPSQPKADLLVSPQHRILVRSQIAHRMFGTDEVLVAAKQLLQIDDIDIADDLDCVIYFHILFDHHEIVLSNGAETESLFTGPEALKSIGPAARHEIFTLFPQLMKMDYQSLPARPLISGRQGRKLAVRHNQHGRMLVC